MQCIFRGISRTTRPTYCPIKWLCSYRSRRIRPFIHLADSVCYGYYRHRFRPSWTFTVRTKLYLESFQYTSLIRPTIPIIKEGLELKPDVQPGVTVYTYSYRKRTSCRKYPYWWRWNLFRLYISFRQHHQRAARGYHPVNIENGIAAMVLAQIGGSHHRRNKGRNATVQRVDRRFDLR